MLTLASAAHERAARNTQRVKKTGKKRKAARNVRRLLQLHSVVATPPTYRKLGGLTNEKRGRSADDQMTEKRKVFKTLIRRWLLVQTSRSLHRIAPPGSCSFVISGPFQAVTHPRLRHYHHQTYHQQPTQKCVLHPTGNSFVSLSSVLV